MRLLRREAVENMVLGVVLGAVLLILAAGSLASSENLRDRVNELEARANRAEAHAAREDALLREWVALAHDLEREIHPPTRQAPARVEPEPDPWRSTLDARFRRWWK